MKLHNQPNPVKFWKYPANQENESDPIGGNTNLIPDEIDLLVPQLKLKVLYRDHVGTVII